MYTHTYILESTYIDSERVRERDGERQAPGRSRGHALFTTKHQAAMGLLCPDQSTRPQPWASCAPRQSARPQPWRCFASSQRHQAVAVVWPLLRAKHQTAAVGLLRCDGQAAAVTARNRQAAAVAFDETACMNGRSSSHTSIYIYLCYIYLCLGFGGSGFGGLGLGGIPIRPSLKAPWRPKRLQA